jgi:MFS family permease
MLEPVVSLWLSTRIGLNTARIGLVFGIAAAAHASLHPVYGRLADRWGGRRLTLVGLVATAVMLPLLPRAWSFESAVGLYTLQAAAVAMVITPSLAYMAEATSAAGVQSFGVAYGLYNFAWGVGLLTGPAIGGYGFERLGFERLALVWMPVVLGATVLLARSRRGP